MIQIKVNEMTSSLAGILRETLRNIGEFFVFVIFLLLLWVCYLATLLGMQDLSSLTND